MNAFIYSLILSLLLPLFLSPILVGESKTEKKQQQTAAQVSTCIYIYISLEKYQTKSKEEQKKYARWRRVCLLLDGWFSQSRIIAAAHSPQTNSFRSRPPHGFIPYIIQ
jgi:uncharacterized lipoprotein YddW (UPF0748 family)